MVSCRDGRSFATRCACAACARLIDRMVCRSGRWRPALTDAVNRQCGDGGGLQRDRRCGRCLVQACERDRRGEQPGQTHKTTAALAAMGLLLVRRLGFFERRVRGAGMPANLGKESLQQPGRRSGREIRRGREKAGRRQLEQESNDCEGRREASAAAQSAGSRTARAEQRAQLASASNESCRGGRSSSSWSGRAVG